MQDTKSANTLKAIQDTLNDPLYKGGFMTDYETIVAIKAIVDKATPPKTNTIDASTGLRYIQDLPNQVDLINPVLKTYHVLTRNVLHPDTLEILYPVGYPVTFKAVADCLQAGIEYVAATDYLSCDPNILTARENVLKNEGV
jgi:hypothetical protein